MKLADKFNLSVAIAILLLLAPHAPQADEFPAHPLKLLVGAPAGGTTDTIARAIAEPMAAALKQPVLVENRPGARGNIAAAAVAKSAPDGYTLLVSFSSHTINATLYPSLPYDPVADFTPITMVESLLVGRANLPADDLKALIELARTKPHTLTIGIGGIGSSLHLAGEKFKQMTGVDLLNVPYKGTAPALTDLLGGQIDLMFISLVRGAEQVRSEKLRAYKDSCCFRICRRSERLCLGLNPAHGLACSGQPNSPMRLPKNSTLSLSLRLQNRNCAIN